MGNSKRYWSIDLGNGVRYRFDAPISHTERMRIDRCKSPELKLEQITSIEPPRKVKRKMNEKKNIIQELLSITSFSYAWLLFVLVYRVTFLT